MENNLYEKESDSITVSLYDGTTYEAELIGYDAGNDIAVLKVEAEGLTPVVIGDSENLNVGDSVIAIGNPLGELTFSLTSGAVSALDREITLSNSVTMELIQTDCAINSAATLVRWSKLAHPGEKFRGMRIRSAPSTGA